MPLGRRVLVAALSSWSRGALQRPGRRMPSHSQYCFHVKDNTFVVGFRLRRPPGKQQGPGSQRLPSPALPDLHWRAGCQNGLRAFLSIGAVGLVCAARRAFQVPLQTAAPRSSVRAIGDLKRSSGRCGPAGLGGHCWCICTKGFRTPNHASPQRRIHWVWVSGSRDPQQREGPGSPRQPIPAFPDVQRRAGCENGLRCFPEQRRGGAGVAR